MEDFHTPTESADISYMERALVEASVAAQMGEVPVGAVIVYSGEIIGRGRNRREELQNPLCHAEISAIEEASRALGSWRLAECDIFVTLEPCVMCMGAILQARLRRLVFGCLDAKAGAAESLYRLGEDARLNHRLPTSGGVLAEECAALLANFFSRLRREKSSTETRRGGRARLKALDSKSSLPTG